MAIHAPDCLNSCSGPAATDIGESFISKSAGLNKNSLSFLVLYAYIILVEIKSFELFPMLIQICVLNFIFSLDF